MAIKYFVDSNGNFLGGFEETYSDIPVGAIEVPTPPEDAGQIWDGSSWGIVPSQPKIYKYVRDGVDEKHFHEIDYKKELTINLYPKRYFSFGELDKVEWFSDNMLTDKILIVDILYNRDSLGFAISRTTTRTYINEDESLNSDVKMTIKDYTINPQDQLDEIIRKRNNNVKQININLIGLIPVLTQADPNIADMTSQDAINAGVAFFATYRNEKFAYIEEGDVALENAVRNETSTQFDWFNTDATSLGIPGVTDIRSYIIFNLSHGLRTT